VKHNNLIALLPAILAANVMAQDCDMAIAPVRFGSYDILSPTPLRTTTFINVSCDVPGIPYNISLDAGLFANGFNRTLKSDKDTLRYNLYQDAAGTRIWGDGTSGSTAMSGVSGQMINRHTVYGIIPAEQKAIPGLFNDQIVITIEW